MKTLMAWTVAFALLVTTSVALAQPGGMGPMGQKGPYFAPTSVEADAAAGSIAIRVVDGDLEKPISNAVVSLVVDDKAVQSGRSAADGSIEFQGEQGIQGPPGPQGLMGPLGLYGKSEIKEIWECLVHQDSKGSREYRDHPGLKDKWDH